MERSLKTPKALVLGATGSIGSVLTAELAKSVSVRALSRREPVRLPPGVEWIKGDVFDQETLLKATNGVEVVFNTIGEMTTRKRDLHTWKVNVVDLVCMCSEQG